MTTPAQFLTVPQAAERLGVVPDTILKWLIRDFLHGSQATWRGRWKIPLSEVERIERELHAPRQ